MAADWAIMLEACLRHDAAPARNRAAPRRPEQSEDTQ